ncbi:MAG: CehA/McbA family metallohydrolase [Gemmataceae bacterium]
MTNVHVRVNDAATNKPTPVRLRIADLAGRTYAPLGRLAEFATGRNEDVGSHVQLGRENFCYIDGSCEVPLPSGVPLTFHVSKGPEYVPLYQEVTLGTGQMALRFTIGRRNDLPAEGWFAGDTRCHFLSPHAALLEGQAEGLALIHLLATETFVVGRDGNSVPAIPNMVAFSGQQPALERPGCIVAVNTLNTHPVLGSLALLHCHRAVFPLSFGGADATDDWSLADWCDQCHRKKGLVVWADPFRFETGIAPEALADLILGRIDAVECTPGSVRLRDWYRAWSAGIRFPLAGASGKDSNRTALGAMRTYAQLAPDTPLSLAAWIDAVRAGRTFVTAGPLMQLRVDDQPPGATLDHVTGAAPLRISASAVSGPSYSALEVVANSEVIGRAEPDLMHSATIEIDYVPTKPCWIAARCIAPPASGGFAHTSPLFVPMDGRLPSDPTVCRDYGDSLDRTVDWVNTVGRFDIPRRKEAMLAILKDVVRRLAAKTTD